MAKKSKKTKKQNDQGLIKTSILIILGLALITFSISLILSMIGYTPTDESFNVSNSDTINNFMGRFGSYSSDFIVNSYGLSIFVFLIPVVIWGVMLIKHQKVIELKIRILATVLGTITLSGVFFIAFSHQLDELNLLGKFSHVLPEFLNSLFISWGIKGYETYITTTLLVLFSFMSFNLATGINFKHWYNIRPRNG